MKLSLALSTLSLLVASTLVEAVPQGGAIPRLQPAKVTPKQATPPPANNAAALKPFGSNGAAVPQKVRGSVPLYTWMWLNALGRARRRRAMAMATRPRVETALAMPRARLLLRPQLLLPRPRRLLPRPRTSPPRLPARRRTPPPTTCRRLSPSIPVRCSQGSQMTVRPCPPPARWRLSRPRTTCAYDVVAPPR